MSDKKDVIVTLDMAIKIANAHNECIAKNMSLSEYREYINSVKDKTLWEAAEITFPENPEEQMENFRSMILFEELKNH